MLLRVIKLEPVLVSFQNKVRQHGEMTLQDMYESQNLVDDDEDDSDWEPEEKHVEVTNCFGCWSNASMFRQIRN